jgi:hypothetical protein
MGGIILAGVVVSRRLLHVRALPKLSKFFASLDWKLMVKGEALFALVLLLTLSAAIFHFLSRHPELAAGLAALSLILFAGAVVFAPPKLIAPPGRMLGASAFVAAVLAFLLVQHSLYAGMGSLEPIWRSAVAGFADYTTGGALFISVMVVLAAWYACGAIDADRRRLPDQLLPAFVALLLAYLFVFFVFTGYILMGYFARYLPLTVFVNDLFLALGLVAIINCTCNWFASFKRSIGWPRIVHGSAAAVAGIGLASAVLYWSNLQAFLFRKLPPDEISFFPILSAPPFRGSTFAASIYGGTLAYFTKNWAYFDTNSALAEGSVILEPDGYRVKRDDSYVWFADRAVNVAYSKPEYFLAMTFQYHGLAQGRGLGHLSDDKDAHRPRVGDVPLIRAIRKGQTSYLHPVEVARDPSPLDRWSIVRLDWDFPPFLRPLQASEFVALHVSSTENGTRIRIEYRYAHQEGVPEAGTRITLFAQPRCASPDQNVIVSPVVVGGDEFILPESFAGTVRAEVQPATATKVGPIYISSPLQIGPVASCPKSSAVSK